MTSGARVDERWLGAEPKGHLTRGTPYQKTAGHEGQRGRGVPEDPPGGLPARLSWG